MRYCICGKTLLRPKERGHREREYCSVACRQRAYRERNKGKHNLERILKEAHERTWNSIDQNIHRETWQDDLERKDALLKSLLERLEKAHDWNDYLEAYTTVQEGTIERLKERLAEKEAEIVLVNGANVEHLLGFMHTFGRARLLPSSEPIGEQD